MMGAIDDAHATVGDGFEEVVRAEGPGKTTPVEEIGGGLPWQGVEDKVGRVRVSLAQEANRAHIPQRSRRDGGAANLAVKGRGHALGPTMFIPCATGKLEKAYG
jgi:hypothetical protein